MSQAPYPGFPPNYTELTDIGGLRRNCLVIEIRSLGNLSPAQLAVVQEQLEATAANLKSRIATIESIELVAANRFDTLLRAGLRLPKG